MWHREQIAGTQERVGRVCRARRDALREGVPEVIWTHASRTHQPLDGSSPGHTVRTSGQLHRGQAQGCCRRRPRRSLPHPFQTLRVPGHRHPDLPFGTTRPLSPSSRPLFLLGTVFNAILSHPPPASISWAFFIGGGSCFISPFDPTFQPRDHPHPCTLWFDTRVESQTNT